MAEQLKLHDAVSRLRLRSVRRLLQDGNACVNARDSSGNTPLHVAVALAPDSEELQLETVKALLDKGASLLLQNNDGNPPLHHAIVNYQGQLKVIQQLFRQGSRVPYLNGHQQTPMQLANFTKKFRPLVKELLKRGTKFHIRKGLYPLLKAVKSPNCSSKIVEMMLENGAELFIHILLEAVQNPTCRTKTVQLLLKNFRNVNGADADGYTPLHFAVSNVKCSSKIVKLLVRAGADVNATTKLHSLTPLHLAIKNKNCQMKVIKILLKEGANPNALSKGGYTPLMYAAKKHATVEVVNALVEKGADMYIERNKYDSATLYAASNPRGEFAVFNRFVHLNYMEIMGLTE